MNIGLSDEATTFGTLVSRALEAAGGDELLRRAEEDARRRQAVVPVLGELGAWDLRPRSSAAELEAAAALCRNAGFWAAPYPVAERLCRPEDVGPEDTDVEGLVVVSASSPAAPIAGLDGRWVAVTTEGRTSAVTTPRGDVTGGGFRRDGFVVGLDGRLEPLATGAAEDVALGLVLPCWTLLGMLDRAVSLTRDYVVERQQFGQSLSEFQGVQFQLTDAEVERAGAEELGTYALWSIQSGQASCVTDALAFRLTTIEAAGVVFRVAHQLHGAIGFCDETVLSWVSRASAPIRRLPFGVAGTLAELTGRIRRDGLPGLFGEGPGGVATGSSPARPSA